MPGQRRLAISRLQVPNLDGSVIATAGNLLSIGAPRHRVNTVFVRSQYTNQQKPGGKTSGKNLLARVPGQRRLALTSANVPDFDGVVVAAASDKFAVRRKSDGVDTVIETSQHMQHTGREKDHQKKTYSLKWPVRVDWQSPDCESQILMVQSPLPLAICFPSGLHATEKTLRLCEVNKRIQRSREGKT
jgi:hypothetical protein